MTLEQRARLAARIVPGGRVLRAWTPAGGVATEVTAVEIERPGGGILGVILRRPSLPAREFRVLQALHAAALPVPRPLALLPPYLALELVAGARIDAPTDLEQMAAALAALHRLDLAWLPAPAGPPAVNRPGLLHGDFWPGNILWRDGSIVAVLDWEDAARGGPLADLGNARLEVLWACGPEAAAAFTRRYRLAMPDLDYTDLAAWDLVAARRAEGQIGGWGLPPERLRRMREDLRAFIAQAEAERGR